MEFLPFLFCPQAANKLHPARISFKKRIGHFARSTARNVINRQKVKDESALE